MALHLPYGIELINPKANIDGGTTWLTVSAS